MLLFTHDIYLMYMFILGSPLHSNHKMVVVNFRQVQIHTYVNNIHLYVVWYRLILTIIIHKYYIILICVCILIGVCVLIFVLFTKHKQCKSIYFFLECSPTTGVQYPTLHAASVSRVVDVPWANWIVVRVAVHHQRRRPGDQRGHRLSSHDVGKRWSRDGCRGGGDEGGGGGVVYDGRGARWIQSQRDAVGWSVYACHRLHDAVECRCEMGVRCGVRWITVTIVLG